MRSRLMTWMPAFIALRATVVSCLPSLGSITMTSAFLLISVSTAAIWAAMSLVGWTASSLTSLNFFASALALLAIAAIHPWSAAGAEKPIVTVLPGAEFAFPTAAAVVAGGEDFLLLPVQAVSTVAAPTPAAPNSISRRPMPMVLGFMRIPSARRYGGVLEAYWLSGGLSAPALQQHGDDDDHALGDVLRLGLQVVQDEQVRDRGEHEDAEYRTGDRAAPTGEQSPADDHRGDGVEFVQVAMCAGPGRGQRRDHDRGDTDTQAGQHVQRRCMAANVDAGEPGGFEVAADGEGAPPVGRAVQHDPADHCDYREYPYQQGDSERLGRRQVVDRVLRDQLGLLLGDPLREAARRGEHGQRRDERHQLPVGDQ